MLAVNRQPQSLPSSTLQTPLEVTRALCAFLRASGWEPLRSGGGIRRAGLRRSALGLSKRLGSAGTALLRDLFVGARRARQLGDRKPEYRCSAEECERVLCADGGIRVWRDGVVDCGSLYPGAGYGPRLGRADWLSI